jgi:biotin transport system substrate-specific component
VYHRQAIIVPDALQRGHAASTARRTLRMAAFILFTAIGAQLAVPLPFSPVPITMQTLFVVLAGMTLGPRDGFIAIVSYLALGLGGAPVFAGFAFGPTAFTGLTGGYLFAFPVAAYAAGRVAELFPGRRAGILTGALTGSLLILVSGTSYLALLTGRSISGALPLAFFPFIPGEIAKALLAVAVSPRR